jgi:hypothetical protein
MNQPMGSCHSHFREIVDLAEELRRHRNQHKGHLSEEQPDLHHEEDDLAAAPVREHSEFDGMAQMDDGMAQMDDNQLEVEGVAGCQGRITEVFEGASNTYGNGTSFMAQFDYDRFANERTANLYYPFASKEEWELASFLLCSSLSMHAIDIFLSSDLVRLEFHWKIGS